MPLYEYKCSECQRLVEKRQKFSDPELTECPHCHGRLERTISAPAVHFAGGGWYADLYSSKAPAKKEGASATDGSAAADAGKGTDSGAKGSEGKGASDGGSTPAPAPAPSSSGSTPSAPASATTAAKT